MSGKKMDTFKIGDTQRPGVNAPKSAGPKKQPAVEPFSMGFRRIEGMLDTEAPEHVMQNMSNIKSMLEAKRDGADNNRDKAAAQKALVAVERTAAVLEYLYQTKAALEAKL